MPLYPDERSAVSYGVWQKTPEIFAQRFEVADISRITDKGLQVQEGTSAILLDAGAVKDVLDAGRYNLESLARKINWFNDPPPRSVILLDSGEFALPISFDNVLTKVCESVKFYGEVILRFTGGKEAATNFVSNVLKDNRSLAFSDLVDRFDPLFRLAVQDMCSESTLDELVHDAERRVRLRDAILRVLEDDLQATGLDVVRVSSGEFTNPEYEQQVRELAEQEKKRQIAELEQRKDLDEHEIEKRRKELEMLKASDMLDMRRRKAEFETEQRIFEDSNRLAKFKDEHELRRAMTALEDEYNLNEIERKENWARLMEKRADEDVARQREREKAERAYKEQEEEEARQKAKIQLVREEKERDEAAIRRAAELDRRWALTDKENARVRQEEIRRFHEAEERRSRRWEAVKVEAQRLWEKKKEDWRQDDERRAREKKNAIEDVEHSIVIDGKQTDAAIEKRKKISDALSNELIRKAQTDSTLSKILTEQEVYKKVTLAEGSVKVKVLEAEGAARTDDIQLEQQIKEAAAWRKETEAQMARLKEERDALGSKNLLLAEKMEHSEDDDVRSYIKAEIGVNIERIKKIDEQLYKLED